jgi:hypothetical protein
VLVALSHIHLRSLAPTKRPSSPFSPSAARTRPHWEGTTSSVCCLRYAPPKTSPRLHPRLFLLLLHHPLRCHCSLAHFRLRPKTHFLSSPSSIRQSAPLSLTAIAAAVIAPAINSLPTSTHFPPSPHLAPRRLFDSSSVRALHSSPDITQHLHANHRTARLIRSPATDQHREGIQ